MTLSFSSYHLRYDEERHVAAYGGRLILAEVLDGGRGTVPDRQAAIGDDAEVRRTFPVIDRWLDLVRAEAARDYAFNGRDDSIELREGNVIVIGSPQGSYGYLYVTAVVER